MGAERSQEKRKRKRKRKRKEKEKDIAPPPCAVSLAKCRRYRGTLSSADWASEGGGQSHRSVTGVWVSLVSEARAKLRIFNFSLRTPPPGSRDGLRSAGEVPSNVGPLLTSSARPIVAQGRGILSPAVQRAISGVGQPRQL